MFRIKGDHDPFESVEEFADNLSRGGEIEFIYGGRKYGITHPEGKLLFGEEHNELSERFFDSIDELLEHEIEGKKIRDIVTVIQPFFRCF